MEMTKENFNAFREDFKQVVTQLEAKYGVNLALGKFSYTQTDFTTKLTVSNNNINMEQEEFNRYCERYGFTPADYKRVYTLRSNKSYQLIGFSSRAKLKGIGLGEDGKKYRLPLDELLGTSNSITPQTSTSNVCKYCGKKKRSQDPDRLCLKCAEQFGHMYYSEL